MVAQVDEQKPAMVAAPIDPSGQSDRLSDMLFPELSAGVGALGVHGEKPLKAGVFDGLARPGQDL